MNLKEFINKEKEIYNLLYEFLEEDAETDFELFFENFFENIIINGEIDNDMLESTLHIIISISNNHLRTPLLNEKIEQIISTLFDTIKQTLTNTQIFNLFKENKRLLLFLFKKQIITIGENILIFLLNKPSHRQFFYPEIKELISEEERQEIEKEILSFDPNIFSTFEEKRQIGENDSYICSLIRNDQVKEFIAHINKKMISKASKIKYSIFETNPLLLEKVTTLIEYAAFYGSIQIFQYLRLSDVKLTPSLWIYAVHSKNPELIHLLESIDIDSSLNFNDPLCESIRCHHNDIACYIENNLLDSNEKDRTMYLNAIRYYNFNYFPDDFDQKEAFYYLYLYGHQKIVDFYIEENKERLEKEVILI